MAGPSHFKTAIPIWWSGWVILAGAPWLGPACVFELNPPRDLEPIPDDSSDTDTVVDDDVFGEPEDDPAPEVAVDDDASDDSTPDDDLDDDSVAPDDAGDDSVEPDADGGGSGDACPGQQECNGVCIASTQVCAVPCVPDCALPNASTECTPSGECLFIECLPGFVDCDGDPSNGCEMNFGFASLQDPDAAPADAPVLEVAPIDLQLGDGAWDDDRVWQDVPMYPIAEPCYECAPVDQFVAEQPIDGKNLPASLDDLMAGFALAWDRSALYLRVHILDDSHVGAAEAGIDDPRSYDNVEFLFDGDSALVGPDDRHLFVGSDGRVLEKSKGEGLASKVQIQTTNVGQCHQLTLRLTGDYLQLGDGEALQLAGDDVYGLLVGVNDYDPGPSESADGGTGAAYQRQTHVFFRDPGNDYWYGARVLPSIQLLE